MMKPKTGTSRNSHALIGMTLALLLGRDFVAIDVFTRPLGLSRNPSEDAVIDFHGDRLFRRLDDPTQARGAFTIALRYGLPGGLDLQAREALQDIENRLQSER